MVKDCRGVAVEEGQVVRLTTFNEYGGEEPELKHVIAKVIRTERGLNFVDAEGIGWHEYLDTPEDVTIIGTVKGFLQFQ